MKELESFVKFMDGMVTEVNATVCRLTEPVVELDKREVMKRGFRR